MHHSFYCLSFAFMFILESINACQSFLSFTMKSSLMFLFVLHNISYSHGLSRLNVVHSVFLFLLSINLILSPCMLTPTAHLIILAVLCKNESLASISTCSQFAPHLFCAYSSLFLRLSIFLIASLI